MPTVTVIQPTITEEKSRMIRCAAYCRVSSDSADQLNSFMAQLKYYENFLADSKTETLINVYADECVTGTREDKREDFQRVNGELIIKSDEAEIVRQIFAWYLSGSGTAAIAKLLNEKSIQKHGQACHWTPVTIKKMLTNEKYVGDQLFQKKYTTDTLPFRQVVNKGEKNQYYYSERHEPIISRETFEKVRQLLYEHKDSFKGIRYNHMTVSAKIPLTSPLILSLRTTGNERRH